MNSALQQKIIEYKQQLKHIQYVVEIGSLDYTGGNRKLFEEADDFCGIDEVRGPGVDMVSDFRDIYRLFDFNPDVILCVNVFKNNNHYKTVIKSIREALMPGGYLFLFMPDRGFVDAFFNGYEVLDLSTVDSTICGLARKPLK